ncbi:MAG: hypothetical protein NPMRth3_740002 [Nitrosopumilales archaeon]|nr:MAG: hypothetical protein NPMRth3_740002 [Nitrosopumilales archaeon]
MNLIIYIEIRFSFKTVNEFITIFSSFFVNERRTGPTINVSNANVRILFYRIDTKRKHFDECLKGYKICH